MNIVAPKPRADATSPNDQQVRAMLATGLRNRWWPVLPSHFVSSGAKPLGLTRGEILLTRKWIGDRLVRQVKIVRMRGAAHDPERRPFAITPQGIVLG